MYKSKLTWFMLKFYKKAQFNYTVHEKSAFELLYILQKNSKLSVGEPTVAHIKNIKKKLKNIVEKSSRINTSKKLITGHIANLPK